MSTLQSVPVGRLSALALISLLRPQQWVKNLFVLVPLLLTPAALSPSLLLAVVAGMTAFCAVTSGMYIVNDYMDRDADRRHPDKRNRPLASGVVNAQLALCLAALLLTAGLSFACWLSPLFAQVLIIYALLILAYSLYLKRFAIIDVLVISFGFMLRVEAGARLAAVDLTVWITIMTGLLALFIALAKRRDDLVRSLDPDHRASLAGYNKPFLDAAVMVILGALLASYLVYTTDEAVMQRIGSDRLVLSAPWVVAGILRYLQILLVEERSGSPTNLLLRDRFLALVVLAWVLTLGLLLYR